MVRIEDVAGTDPRDEFDWLSEVSQRSNRKLRVIAQELVDDAARGDARPWEYD